MALKKTILNGWHILHKSVRVCNCLIIKEKKNSLSKTFLYV